MRPVLPPLAFLVSLFVMAGLHFGAPLRSWEGGFATTAVALVLLTSGLSLTVSQAQRFARAGANIKTFDPPTALMRTGPYRFTRNPMYLGFVMTLLGVWFLLLSATALLPVLGFAAACNFLYIPHEEREMKRVYGRDYDDYRQTVRRWI